jgi:hypothetical protein
VGTWGFDTFDNDTAGDWAFGLEGAADLGYVRETLERVLAAEDDYLDVDGACEGLAACEVIARLKGNWGARNAYTEIVDGWVEGHRIDPPAGLVDKALTVIDRVTAADSELRELWEEEDASEWLAAVADLRARVVGDKQTP